MQERRTVKRLLKKSKRNMMMTRFSGSLRYRVPQSSGKQEPGNPLRSRLISSHIQCPLLTKLTSCQLAKGKDVKGLDLFP